MVTSCRSKSGEEWRADTCSFYQLCGGRYQACLASLASLPWGSRAWAAGALWGRLNTGKLCFAIQCYFWLQMEWRKWWSLRLKDGYVSTLRALGEEALSDACPILELEVEQATLPASRMALGSPGIVPMGPDAADEGRGQSWSCLVSSGVPDGSSAIFSGTHSVFPSGKNKVCFHGWASSCFNQTAFYSSKWLIL